MHSLLQQQPGIGNHTLGTACHQIIATHIVEGFYKRVFHAKLYNPSTIKKYAYDLAKKISFVCFSTQLTVLLMSL